ncbi:DNA polymerase III subunit delta [Methylocaldum sp. MU1018]
MKLSAEQLGEQLKKRLAPLYFLSGDEPLQLAETADAVRQAARAAGHGNRELFYADTGFDWSALQEAADSFSLFGEKRILDLRLPAKPDKAAAAALLRYAERPAEDAVLIVSAGKIAGADQKSRWYQAIDRIGVVVQVWPPEGEQLLRWLDRRLSTKGLLADKSGIRILAARVEGNLLAAAQEIEKLHILYGKGKIDDDQIVKAVADNARYDVFDLAEETLRGHTAKAYRVLMGLKAEGVAPAVALWALARDVRLLGHVMALVAQGTPTDTALAKCQVWDKRKPAVLQALQRLNRDGVHQTLLLSARVDRMIKGMETGDPWEGLLSVCVSLAAPSGNRFMAGSG